MQVRRRPWKPLALAFFVLFSLVGIASPARSAPPQKEYAVALRATHGPDQLGNAATQRSMVEAKKAGVNTVVFIYEWCQKDQNASSMRSCPNTPSGASLRLAIHHAQALSLKTVVAIHQEAQNGVWRGKFCPQNRPQWFVNEQSMLIHVGQIAQVTHASEYIVGAEMPCLTLDSHDSANSSQWRSLIGHVRSVYSGLVSYTAQRDSNLDSYSEIDKIDYWDALDVIGASAYYPMKVTSPVTVQKLQDQWEAIDQRSYGPLAQTWHKPIVMTEVGFRSVSGAHEDPYDWQRAGMLDLQEQARDYEAVLRFVRSSSNVMGVHLWEWNPDPLAGGSKDKSYSPQGKPAQSVMHKFMTLQQS